MGTPMACAPLHAVLEAPTHKLAVYLSFSTRMNKISPTFALTLSTFCVAHPQVVLQLMHTR